MQRGLRDRRVLIVDDDVDFARSLGDVLEADDYTVSMAHSAANSVGALKSSAADVVILDVNLGDGDGVELIQTLQNERPDIQCVVLTAFASTDSVIQALHERAYDYLRKPISPPGFLLTLDRCFESMALRRQAEDAEARLAARNAELETVNAWLRKTVATATELTAAAGDYGDDRRLLEAVAENMNAQGGSLFYRRGESLVLAHALDSGHIPAAIDVSAMSDNSLVSLALRTAEPQFVADVSADPSIERSGWSGYSDGSALVFPLAEGGEVFGVLTLHNKTPPPFTPRDLDIGTIIVSLVTEVLVSRKAGEALRRSETRFRNLVEKNSDVIAVIDTAGAVHFESGFGEKTLGWESGELTGRSVFGLLHPEERSWLLRLLRTDLAEPGSVSHIEHRFRGKDGNYRILESFATNLSDSPEIGGLVINSRDITARKALENRLQIIFDRAPDALYLLDLNGTYVDANLAAEKLVGYDREGIVGRAMTTSGLLREQDVGRMKDLLARTAAGESTGPDEFLLVRGDGTEATAEVFTHPVEIDGDTYVLGVARDVTSRRIAEHALRESEAKYKTLFAAAGDGILILDGDRFVDCNPGACEFFGLSREEIVGRAPHELSPEFQCDGSPSAEAAKAQISAALVGGETSRFEWQHQRRGSEIVVGEIALSRIVLNDKAYLQAIVRDITERKRAEEREREHEKELFQAGKMASLGTLVSGVAHEINNPNNFIRLSTENLAELWKDISTNLRMVNDTHHPVSLRGIPLDKAEKMLDSIINGLSEGSVRIETLVKSLREYAQPDEGELDQTVDLNAVVVSAEIIVRSLLRKSTNSYEFAPSSDLPSVPGNYHQIEQVVLNLLTNACHALESADRGIHVSTAYDAESCRAVVLVRDEGEGISDTDILRITDPFFTTKRDIGGTGLGLSVSQRIVQNHGGELSFDSSPGLGTTAMISLPVKNVSRGDSSVTDSPASSSPPVS